MSIFFNSRSNQMPSQTVSSLINNLRTARGLFKPDWPKRIAAAQQLGALRAVEAVGDLAAVISEKKNADLCLNSSTKFVGD